ncbi:putative toxin biosynthesis peroxidase [Aspergillus sclerotioniger CBS 115572]|uniref:Putative toxin biosynthesis peroxidase n=1 Tax=Aspergillus sclerotioniger CBS 115572 TaxID=1450535 RepID=A0A317X987_9EURO|nr:putative toxin biosynthesis peroxidase [Aspergillus sclerotioniger CBS 115572]PWY93120.1 putative toxin biosynthesis peroxidase [Aspergillus sclerotioniger CBS 115572]
MKVLAIICLWLTIVHCYPGGMDWDYAVRYHQQVLLEDTDRGFGLNEPFIPTPAHILPEKKPFLINESVNYYERRFNGSGPDGNYRRSSCPAVNALANRGYINRTGRNISYSELAHAVRRVWNFGDDNTNHTNSDMQSMLVLAPTFAMHGWPETIDLDQFNACPTPPFHSSLSLPSTNIPHQDDQVQYVINCPAAPTRNDRAVGDNINLNMTLFESLLSFSKDGETLSLEDMAEHHHLRHNQSKAENPGFVFGNQGAICSLAQYTNMVGVLGKFGKHGRTTLFVDDVKTFYLDEDIPRDYERREAPVS